MTQLGVRALLSAYAAGRLRPRDVLERVYADIERRGTRPVWISLRPFEAALAALERASGHAEERPLLGVPFAVKDNIDVAGLPTTAGCPEFAYTPEVSATVVQRLEAAGAIVIGKTNLDQFATGLVGTRSPYGACASVFDARYISGGSSSGSAVAVARGDVSFALGTDTAGSGRVPAAFNALVGLKPTRGLLSAYGTVPACRSLDCVSIFSHSVEDAALVLQAAQGFDAQDPYSRERPTRAMELPSRCRLGVPTKASLEFFGDSESHARFDRAIDALATRVSVELVPVDLTPFRDAAALLYHGPWIAERLAAVGSFLARRPEALDATVRSILQSAPRYTAQDAFEGMYRLRQLARATEPVWRTIDALVVPTAPTHYTMEAVSADPIRLNQNLGTYTNFVNLLDLAAIAVPAGFRQNGLPFGITFIAPAFHEPELVALSARFLGESWRPSEPEPGRVLLSVAGAHLSGQPLNHELVSRGAELVRSTYTAPEYRLFALKTVPPKPALLHAPKGGGRPIEVEVWALTESAFGSFVRGIPAPMTIGTTRLEDGTTVKGFTCEPYALENAEDITSFGGWRPFLAHAKARTHSSTPD